MSSTRPERRQAGITLVELIVFILVVSVAIAAVLAGLSLTTRASPDPLVQKQALAIAESLLEEIELMPFTTCDPDDSGAATGVCATTPESTAGGGGPEAGQGETRYNAPFPFDNVNDYNGFTMAGIRDITNTPIPNLGGYTATVAIAQQAIGTVPAAESLLITVTVTGPANTSVRLQGMRTRYAATALP